MKRGVVILTEFMQNFVSLSEPSQFKCSESNEPQNEETQIFGLALTSNKVYEFVSQKRSCMPVL